jgi:protein-tyrosine phosphatase
VIDLHSHLLPGIDDGASTIKDAMQLARHAVGDGITHMVVTPHIQPGVYENTLNTIRDVFERFRDALSDADIPLTVAMAAEVRLCPEIMLLLERQQLPMFESEEGKRTLLLELPHSHVPPGTDKMLGWLLRQGIGIVIAHPERNKELMRKPDMLARLYESGCMLQLTAGSLAGRFGEEVRKVARNIVAQGMCGLLASDAHNLRHRPPQLSDGKQAAAEIIGSAQAESLVWDKPMQLVSGMFK